MDTEQIRIVMGTLRRRVGWLMLERWALIGGAAGCLLACVFVLLSAKLDFFLNYALWAGAVLLGLVLGAVYGVLKIPDDLALAVETDRRCGLRERLSTAYIIEKGEVSGDIERAVLADTRAHITDLHPQGVFPHRFARVHLLFLCLLALLLGIVYLPQTSIFIGQTRRADIATMKSQGNKLEQVAKEIRKSPQSEDLQRLSRNLQNLGKKMQSGRMDKKLAMLKLQDIEKQIEHQQNKTAADGKPLKSMQEAARQMAAKGLENTEKLAQQIADEKGIPLNEALKQVPSDARMGELARKEGPLAEAERNELSSLIEKYTEPDFSVQVPAELAEAMAKLLQNEDYQKAMQLMQELMKKLDQEKGSRGAEDLDKLLQQMAEALRGTDLDELSKMMRKQAEQLAKMTPEELQELLDKMKNDCECTSLLSMASQACDSASAMLSGMHQSQSASSQPSTGNSGVGDGSPESQQYSTGPPTQLNKVKNTAKVSGSVGKSGMLFSAGKSKGAPDVTGSSRVSYTELLPTYKKAAEESVNSEEIPPAYKKLVKDYFGSLE